MREEAPVRVVDAVDVAPAVEVQDPSTCGSRRHRAHPEDRPAVSILPGDLDAPRQPARRLDRARMRHELGQVTFGQVSGAIVAVAPLQAQDHGHESSRDDHAPSPRLRWRTTYINRRGAHEGRPDLRLLRSLWVANTMMYVVRHTSSVGEAEVRACALPRPRVRDVARISSDVAPEVTCSAVACPSGQRSTPRKRVWG